MKRHVLWIVCFATLIAGCRSAKPPAPLPPVEPYVSGPVTCIPAGEKFQCTAPFGLWVLWTKPEYSATGEEIAYPAPAEWTTLEWTNGRSGVQLNVRYANGRVEFSSNRYSN